MIVGRTVFPGATVCALAGRSEGQYVHGQRRAAPWAQEPECSLECSFGEVLRRALIIRGYATGPDAPEQLPTSSGSGREVLRPAYQIS
jgi:hypothetical protein